MTPAPLIAWMPFLEPVPGLRDAWWLLSIPLIFGISTAYKAIRAGRLERFWMQVSWFSARVLMIMVALALALFVVVRIVLPLLPV